MNQRLLVLLGILAASLIAACGGGDPAQDHLHLTDPDAGGKFSIDKGGEVMIVLSSNASTGFAWRVVEPLAPQFEISAAPRYVPPGTTQDALGAAGTQIFTFLAATKGTAELKLAYSRSFEPGVAPSKTFVATITVD